MFRRIFVLTIYCLALWLPARADYYPRDWNVDVKHYRFMLDLNDDSNLIRGRASIQIFFHDKVESFSLDLINSNELGKGMTVKSVKITDHKISYAHENNKLKIVPKKPFSKDESIEVLVEYEGIPADGLIISNNKFGSRTFFGDNWPNRARHWLPSVDHPSDKAGVEFIINAPSKYQVIANGIKVEESTIEPGITLTHWVEEVDISTKVMVIGVAEFAINLSGKMDEIPVEAWVFPENRKEGFYDYSQAVEILEYFDDQVGEYPYRKLANVQSKTRYGGMENASNIFYYENSVTGNREIENLLAHEIAHQWFGNSASEKDWHHVWLSEGFATYFTHLYVEHKYGVDRLKARMNNDRQEIIEYYYQKPAPIVDTSIRDYNDLLNTNSYQKGGWVLHMLRNYIGDDAYWKGIRSYYAKYRENNALTEDFQYEMETASSSDLSTFFDQWIFKPGQPRIRVSYEYSSESKQLKVIVEQLQTDTIFVFPLEIEANLPGKGSKKFIAEMKDAKQSFYFDCEQSPQEIKLDPEVKLLFTLDSLIKN